MTTQDVEAIERATIAAVAPRRTLEIDGWLVALEPGAIRRAASAAPLRHDLSAGPATLDAIEQAFAGAGMRPAFRLADAPGLAEVRRALEARGYGCEQPTLVKVGSADALARFTSSPPADLLERPDAGWAAVFTGEGFDPRDGADRVAALSRSPEAAYGAVREGDVTLAVGAVAFGHGWASVHGMRTARARRGEGLAGRVLTALGAAAQARGVERMFLQVEEANHGARSLYRRAGFEARWRYFYWSRPD